MREYVFDAEDYFFGEEERKRRRLKEMQRDYFLQKKIADDYLELKEWLAESGVDIRDYLTEEKFLPPDVSKYEKDFTEEEAERFSNFRDGIEDAYLARRNFYMWDYLRKQRELQSKLFSQQRTFSGTK
jgi:hypothetical protein